MKSFPFLFFFCLLIFCIVKIDRFCLKKNSGFNIHYIHSKLDCRPEWQIEPNLLPQNEELSPIFNQKFSYLDKGHQSYVFISEDQNYVIKFYRFPSHLRNGPQLSHLFSDHFSRKRLKTIKYNLEKLLLTFQSYKLAFEELKEESGLIYVHLNPTDSLNQNLRIRDILGVEYEVNLDSVPFVVQKKAKLFYSALHAAIENNRISVAKKIIENLIHLIRSRCQKGISDKDPILEKNYGAVDNNVITIDIGRFVKDESLKDSSNQMQEVTKITSNLQFWLKKHNQELFEYFINESKNR